MAKQMSDPRVLSQLVGGQDKVIRDLNRKIFTWETNFKMILEDNGGELRVHKRLFEKVLKKNIMHTVDEETGELIFNLIDLNYDDKVEK